MGRLDFVIGWNVSVIDRYDAYIDKNESVIDLYEAVIKVDEAVVDAAHPARARGLLDGGRRGGSN